MKKMIILLIMMNSILSVYSNEFKLEENKVAKSSEINFTFVSEKPRFTQVMNIKTHVIDEERSGGIDMEIYRILCKDKEVVAEKYIRVKGKDFLEKKMKYPFSKYFRLWQKIIKFGVFELRNVPFLDEIKSNEEFEKMFKGIGDLSTYEFRFIVDMKTNIYKVRNISQLRNTRYNDIFQEIRLFLKLEKDEGM